MQTEMLVWKTSNQRNNIFMDIKIYLNKKKAIVEGVLYGSILDESIPERLRSAMLYSLEAGGKRLRPILVIAGAEAVGGEAARVMKTAIAMEMIHTFSLIHDDLPAMDNDNFRRGKPTNHKVYGEGMAILAGDGLLAEAFSVIASTEGVEPSLLVQTILDIATATGGRGMTGGQVIDIESTGKKITEGELTKLHLLKTGALIKASVTNGARLSGATREDIIALAGYGEAIGLAFQIADDILDIESSEGVLGKDIGSDEAKGKNTYPSIIGIEASKRKAADLVEEAVSLVARFGDRAEPLKLLAGYVVERRS